MRMRHDSLRRAAGIVLAALVVLAAWSPPFRSLVDCPSELRLVVGEEERVYLLGLPLSAVITGDADGVLHINGEAPSAGRWLVDLGRPLELSPLAEGRCRLDLSLLGILPVKRITVQVVPRVRVVPGGQSIGIVLRTKGVAVVGHAPVKTPDEGPVYPAREAGVQVGDVILRVDGQEVKSNEHIVFLVNRCAREGRPVPLELSRDGRTVRLEVTPRYSAEDGFYQIGLYVRDGAAGVGTLTFYDPETRIFMALGHVITDAATNRPLELGDGRIVKASVVRVRPGRRGEPGEKEGTFVDGEDVIGVITGNTDYGIVGRLTVGPLPGGGRAVPVALAREVRTGPAEILTVVDGHTVERFQVEITDVQALQTRPGPKGITVRITDPRLIRETGGIVQGMSGSPILQDGRLVGAVTHVFINDPTRGYGVFAEWMVREAGLLPASSGVRDGSQPALSCSVGVTGLMKGGYSCQL